MNRLQLLVLATLATAAAVAACGKKPDTTPTPVAAPDTAGQGQRRADSLAQAQADSARRAQEEADRVARQRAADSLAALAKSGDEVKATLAMMIHFDFDKASILAGDQQTLDQKIAILQKNPSLRVQISGHCDERGSDEYNLALGNRRANAAKQYLVSHGIDASRIETISYGEERPLSPGHDEDSWAQNRRDEFTILAGGDALQKP